MISAYTSPSSSSSYSSYPATPSGVSARASRTAARLSRSASEIRAIRDARTWPRKEKKRSETNSARDAPPDPAPNVTPKRVAASSIPSRNPPGMRYLPSGADSSPPSKSVEAASVMPPTIPPPNSASTARSDSSIWCESRARSRWRLQASRASVLHSATVRPESNPFFLANAPASVAEAAPPPSSSLKVGEKITRVPAHSKISATFEGSSGPELRRKSSSPAPSPSDGTPPPSPSPSFSNRCLRSYRAPPILAAPDQCASFLPRSLIILARTASHSTSMLLRLSNPAECLPRMAVAFRWLLAANLVWPASMLVRRVVGSLSRASSLARRRLSLSFSATSALASRRSASTASLTSSIRAMPSASLARPASDASTLFPILRTASVASMNLE